LKYSRDLGTRLADLGDVVQHAVAVDNIKGIIFKRERENARPLEGFVFESFDIDPHPHPLHRLLRQIDSTLYRTAPGQPRAARTHFSDSSVRSTPEYPAPRRINCSASAPCPSLISRVRFPRQSGLSRFSRM